MTQSQAKQLYRMSRELFHQAYRHSLTRENRELMANMKEQIRILGHIINKQESRQNASMERFSDWRANATRAAKESTTLARG